MNRFPVGILGVHGNHTSVQVNQNAQRVQVIGVHILVDDLYDGIALDTGAIPSSLLSEHLVEPESLHVAIAFEKVAVDLVGDAFRHRLEAGPDRFFDGEAGVVGNQSDNHHRDEAE